MLSLGLVKQLLLTGCHAFYPELRQFIGTRSALPWHYCVFTCLCVEHNMVFMFVSPQAPVLHLPAASVPAQCFPAGTDAAGEMEAQVARHHW